MSDVRPYGTWPSPLTPASVAAEPGAPAWPQVVDDVVWWCGADPVDGRAGLLRRTGDGPVTAALPGRWSVRNGAIGYGGRPFLADANRVVFTGYADHRLYLSVDGGDPIPLTPPDPPGLVTWYADPQWLGPDAVLCVRELTLDSRGDPAPRTRRDVVRVPLSGSAGAGELTVVLRADDFLTSVRVSPDGRRLAWVGWDHPDMPWDSATLWVRDLADVDAAPRALRGGDGVSVAQAEWAPDGTLWAMADSDGWWNLHSVDPDTGASRNVHPVEQDCAGAVWRVGATWFHVAGDTVVMVAGDGAQRLVARAADGSVHDLAPGWTHFGSDLTGDADSVVVSAASETSGPVILRVPVDGSAPAVVGAADAPGPHTSLPTRRTAHDASGQAVHYVWYPPTHPDVRGPDGERPPLVVHVHGGPTSRTAPAPDGTHSLFTSRGFAVVSVDYGGSTGYGRAYRDRLRHTWGTVDVQDCVTVVRALAESGEIDPARVVIRGGSAGGWTSLACVTSPVADGVFAAAAVYYPIADALHWSGEDTHDFESRYMQYLVGRLPEDRERYETVSPQANVDRLRVPIVMLQGDADPICPPRHAHGVVDALRELGRGELVRRFKLFPGEMHGFRQASSTEASLTAELELYADALALRDGTVS